MLDARIAAYRDALARAGARASFEAWNEYPPATDDDLASLAAAARRELPTDLVCWLRSVGSGLPLQGNYTTTSTPHIVDALTRTAGIDFSTHLANITSWGDGRFDDERLARTYWCTAWVPIAEDGCGNQICVDLAPGPRGTVGQLLAMEFQDGQGPYLGAWPNLRAMVDAHLAMLEHGDFEVDDEGFIEFG